MISTTDVSDGLDGQFSGDLDAVDDFADYMAQTQPMDSLGSRHVQADPDNVEQGLAKLVLTLIELIRQLLEKQAIRRMEGGSLTDEEIERMGQTFMKLEQKMTELKAAFGLEHEELNLNLGPLGDLL